MDGPENYTGIYSCDGMESRIEQFIFHSKRQISFEFTADDNNYFVQLMSEDGVIFRGDFHNATEEDRGSVMGSTVSFIEKELHIVGVWYESGTQKRWYMRVADVL